ISALNYDLMVKAIQEMYESYIMEIEIFAGDDTMDVNPKKFFGFQLIAVLIIWGGMTFFLDNIVGSGKIIYYVVTSWLLLLIVLFIKSLFQPKEKAEVIDLNKKKEK